jgi:hypothetical protein
MAFHFDFMTVNSKSRTNYQLTTSGHSEGPVTKNLVSFTQSRLKYTRVYRIYRFYSNSVDFWIGTDDDSARSTADISHVVKRSQPDELCHIGIFQVVIGPVTNWKMVDMMAASGG